MDSHFCWASTQNKLVAVSRNLKHPKVSTFSHPSLKIVKCEMQIKLFAERRKLQLMSNESTKKLADSI
jgi:hypothetical protein